MATTNIHLVEEALPEQAPPVRWALAHRVAFRFVFCYLVLYCMPEMGRANALGIVPGASWVIKWYVDLWHAINPWVAIHLFGLSGQRVAYTMTGSGDTTLSSVENFLFLVIAAAGTLIWSILDCARPNYRTLHIWLRLLVRYTLAYTLLTYGFVKVVPMQFQPPRLDTLMEPYGELSPMGVLWNFMGASISYTVFSGAAEVVGGLLLLFRRTAPVGAFFSMGVLANVVALNFCYDVPVKLYSTNLLLMTIFLAAPYLRGLANVLVLNRAAPPIEPMAVRFEHRWLRAGSVVVWAMFVAFMLFTQVTGALRGYQQIYAGVKHVPVYGLYDVESFEINGRPMPTGADATRWRKVALMDQMIAVRTMGDAMTRYRATYETASNRVTLANAGQLVWSQDGADTLAVEGAVKFDTVKARLRKVDLNKLALVSRGFHWIQEFPYNR